MKDETNGLTTTCNRKFDALLSLQRISPKDLDTLNPAERSSFFDLLNTRMNELTGEPRDDFEHKIELLLQPEVKRQIWENNHGLIVIAYEHFLKTQGMTPTHTYLAQQTGISRQSISKHIKEYEQSANKLEQPEQQKFVGDQLLNVVLKKAFNGDMRAAQLYFNITKPKAEPANTGNRTLVQTQNNFMQINNTVLNQDKLNQLSPEQLSAIEGIINTPLQQPLLKEAEVVEG